MDSKSAGTSSTLSGAPELFAQMLDKIIANAVDFSAANSLISLSLHTTEKQLSLQISNQGAILPDKMQHQLFDSMVSVRQSQSTEQAHLGLGLFIAKIITQYHQGDISISNLADASGVVVTLNFTLR